MSGGGGDPGDRPGGSYSGAPPLGLATAAAAAAPAALFLLAGPYAAFCAFAVAWLHAVGLGLPVYLVLSRTRPLTDGASIGGGCLVGALPMLSAATLMLLLGGRFAGVDDGFTALFAAFVFGFLGMLGGAGFWAVMRGHAEPRFPGPPAR